MPTERLKSRGCQIQSEDHQADIPFTKSLRPQCYQAIHSGGPELMSTKDAIFTSYVQHYDSGKNRHSIISTKPPIITRAL